MEMDRQRAYTELLERYRPLVWRMCWFSARGNWDRCNDLVQEVSIALWLHFDALRPDATPGEKRAWIYWQSRSILDLQRRLQKPPMQPLTTLLEKTVAAEDTRHTQEEIEELMAALSPEEQRLVGLYLEGYQTKEIADLMNLSHDTVYQRMHRAVGKARKAIVALFLLLVATSISIAVVPSWRQRVFSSGEPSVDTLSVSDSAPVAAGVPRVVDTLSAPAEIDTLLPRDMPPPVEHINITTTDIITIGDAPPPPSAKRLLPATITITGTILTVSGLDGEWVILYNKSGHAISSKRCHGMCSFELPANKGSFYGSLQYNLHAGDTLWIKLRI
jgi:RNA polymerase sigma factor (sigma-70 family)